MRQQAWEKLLHFMQMCMPYVILHHSLSYPQTTFLIQLKHSKNSHGTNMYRRKCPTLLLVARNIRRPHQEPVGNTTPYWPTGVIKTKIHSGPTPALGSHLSLQLPNGLCLFWALPMRALQVVLALQKTLLRHSQWLSARLESLQAILKLPSQLGSGRGQQWTKWGWK